MRDASFRPAAGLVTLAIGWTLLAAGCGGDGSTPAPQAPADFVATESDFECLENWAKVRHMRITNRLGHLEEALALAENPEPGKQFPVGTIVQLFPGEAMVKRGPDYDPANNNWEYFELRVSRESTTINVRGRDDVINMFGAQCWGCHQAARDFDFLCEEDRGCIDLPIGAREVEALQNADPRCSE
jgi:hypothetical protein